MKSIKKVITLFLIAVLFIGCGDKTNKTNNKTLDDEVVTEENDSTVYGVCGEGTAMHTLELITDQGDSLNYLVDMEDDDASVVKGGLLVGDRMAVISYQSSDGEIIAKNVINITTLIGKWTSIDKSFEIQEGGLVKSNVKAENNPWTSWKILNGNLILNKDTFNINSLGADSLYIENKEGIYAYKRIK